MSGHSLWSPSSLHRRLACLGSANAEDGLPDSTSEVAAEGTCAHSIREMCLVGSKDVDEFVGTVVEADGFKFEVTRDWVKLLQPGIDRARELRGLSKTPLAKALFVEHRVSLDAWMPEEGGTLDTGVVIRDKAGEVVKVHVIDLKFGRDPVAAFENPQLMAYGLGFLADMDLLSKPDLEVELTIDQPRAPGHGDSWTTTVGALLAFGERLAAAYRIGRDPNAPRTPTPSGCKYCKAADHCAELGGFIVDLFDLANAGGKPMIPEADRLSVERLAVLLQNAKLVKNTLEKYENRGRQELEEGRTDSATLGMKLVSGAGRRNWRDEAEAEKFLTSKLPRKTDAFNQKLISPAEAENILGTRNWTKAQELIEVSEGKPLLVPLSDKRQELIPVTNLLDDLPDDGLEEMLDDLIGDEPIEAESVDADSLI